MTGTGRKETAARSRLALRTRRNRDLQKALGQKPVVVGLVTPSIAGKDT